MGYEEQDRGGDSGDASRRSKEKREERTKSRGRRRLSLRDLLVLKHQKDTRETSHPRRKSREPVCTKLPGEVLSAFHQDQRACSVSRLSRRVEKQKERLLPSPSSAAAFVDPFFASWFPRSTGSSLVM